MSNSEPPKLPPKNDKIKNLAIQIDDVKDVMQNNIKAMNQNLDDTEHLQTQSEELKALSGEFVKNTTTLKRQMCWKNAKLKIIIAAIVLIILAIIIFIIVMSFKS